MLARKLGMTVERLLNEITAEEFERWKGYADFRTQLHQRAAKAKKQMVDTW